MTRIQVAAAVIVGYWLGRGHRESWGRCSPRRAPGASPGDLRRWWIGPRRLLQSSPEFAELSESVRGGQAPRCCESGGHDGRHRADRWTTNDRLAAGSDEVARVPAAALVEDTASMAEVVTGDTVDTVGDVGDDIAGTVGKVARDTAGTVRGKLLATRWAWCEVATTPRARVLRKITRDTAGTVGRAAGDTVATVGKVAGGALGAAGALGAGSGQKRHAAETTATRARTTPWRGGESRRRPASAVVRRGSGGEREAPPPEDRDEGDGETQRHGQRNNRRGDRPAGGVTSRPRRAGRRRRRKPPGIRSRGVRPWLHAGVGGKHRAKKSIGPIVEQHEDDAIVRSKTVDSDSVRPSRAWTTTSPRGP